jgi:Tol biopolymer transport system component
MRISYRRVAHCVVIAVAVLLLGGCDVAWITRASVDSTGSNPNGDSGSILETRFLDGISLSGDGRYVAFESLATDLLPGGNTAGVFLRDLATGTTVRVSGGRSPSLTNDGRLVAYTDQSTGPSEVWVYDRTDASKKLVSAKLNGEASGAQNRAPVISADGRYVAWSSDATGLVAGNFEGLNVYRRDLLLGVTTVVSVNMQGGQADGPAGQPPSISADGRYIAFFSQATDLTTDPWTGFGTEFVRDMQAGTTTLAGVDTSGTPVMANNGAISGDGTVVVYSAFTVEPNSQVLYAHNLALGTASLLSVNAAGQLVDACCFLPTISSDGKYVAFLSNLNLVGDDHNNKTDVYVRDLAAAQTRRVSLDAIGAEGAAGAAVDRISLSADGRYVAFATLSRLVSTDTSSQDVYVRATRLPYIDRISPETVPRGQTQTFVITGQDFTPNLYVRAQTQSGDSAHVSVDQVDVVSSTELHVSVTVDSAAPTGSLVLRVVVPGPGPGAVDGSSSACSSCPVIT